MATSAQPLPETLDDHHSDSAISPDMRVVLCLPPGAEMDDEQFFEFSCLNDNFVIERKAGGEIIVMSPSVGETGYREHEIGKQLGNWADSDGTGIVFVSDTIFDLPSGGNYGPDASWVLRSRLAELTREQKRRMLPLAPDFILELMSPSDRISQTREKMQMWIESGVRLGWMMDPDRRRVHIYSESRIQELENPSTISGDPVLPGFVLDLAPIWDPGW